MREIEARRRDELALGADALKEHDQRQLEKDHRVDLGPFLIGKGVLDPLIHEAEIQRGLEMAGAMPVRNEILQ